MMLNTKTIHNPFWRNFPARAKQMPSKVSYVSKKKRRHFEFAYFSFFLTHLELKRKLRSYTSVVPSKTIPDSRPKWAKCIFVFRPKRRKNPTRWGGTYVAYIRESPPPPHPGLLPCTNMDPDECVIFAYDGVPAYRDPVISSPYVQSLCLPAPPLLPPSIPLNIFKQGYCIKPSERYNQGRHLTSGNSKTFG